MSSTTPSFVSKLNPGGYARWWVDELRGMMPAWMAGWFAGDAALVEMGADDSALHLVRIGQGRARIVQSVPRAEVSTSPVLRELVSQEQDRVRLVLSQGQVLVRMLSLPAAIEENLSEAIGFEIDRVTPFKAGQVHYAARVTARDAQKETIEVMLVVLPRTRLDSLLAPVRQAGLSVVESGADPELTGGQFIDLLPATMKPPRKWGQMTRINLGLTAAAGGLLLLALLLPVWQKRERVIALIPLVDKAATEFATNRKIYDEYAKLAGDYNHIANKKHAAQPVMAVIEELTRMSPDTTFTQTLELKNSGKVRELVMMGEAASASKVIESLEQSPLFQNASQRSQTTRGSQPNTERYHVATEIKPRPVPAAILVELEPPPTMPAAAMTEPTAPPVMLLDAKPAPVDQKTVPGVATVAVQAPPPSTGVNPAAISATGATLPASVGTPAKPAATPITGKPVTVSVPGAPASTPPNSKVQP